MYNTIASTAEIAGNFGASDSFLFRFFWLLLRSPLVVFAAPLCAASNFNSTTAEADDENAVDDDAAASTTDDDALEESRMTALLASDTSATLLADFFLLEIFIFCPLKFSWLIGSSDFLYEEERLIHA